MNESTVEFLANAILDSYYNMKSKLDFWIQDENQVISIIINSNIKIIIHYNNNLFNDIIMTYNNINDALITLFNKVRSNNLYCNAYLILDNNEIKIINIKHNYII